MAAVLENAYPEVAQTGGSFLFQSVGSTRFVTPEHFTEEQRLYYRTALQFCREQVMPKAGVIESKDPALLRELLAKAGELGLLMIDIAERHGGLALDKTTSALVAEAQSLLGAWSVTFGAHVGIGSLPIVWFGTEAQKAKYLPKLATGEWVAAYALTETGSGSDALGARCKAVLSEDRTHYVLNGSKQFITNAAFADVFVVFAKIDGEKFTGFIVDRSTPGLSIGAEEHKMGIRGSSTCALIFEDARVPAENLLGEIGKGHKIAFNILNLGRLKLGVGVVGGMKIAIEDALRYAQDRKQFKTPIVKFPILREKFAKMAAQTYAIESMAYRTTGNIDARLASEDKAAQDYDAKLIAAIEEFAIEASILKVAGSEALTSVVDEAVQIHGGYGFTAEYAVERAYRDQRINRIFEGTNEINRMLITGMLLKRALKGQVPLLELAQTVADELEQNALPSLDSIDALAEDALTAEYLKRTAIYALKVAVETFGPEIEAHQDVLAAISDIVSDAYAIDSMVARTRQASSQGKLDAVRVAMVQLMAAEASSRALDRARKAICASAKGEDLEKHLAHLDKLARFTPFDPAEARETILAALEEKQGYPFAY